MFLIFDSDMGGATVHRKHCCVFMAMLSIFILLLTETYVCQKYKGFQWELL
jgi:hypothetical protein